MPQRIIKNILSKNIILPYNKGKRFIFIYHDVSEKSDIQHSVNYSTTIEKFKQQISFLSNLFEWVDLNEISRAEPFKQNVASISFDDGFKSVQTNALPILKKNNIPFSIFANQCAIKNNRLWVSDLEFNNAHFKDDYETNTDVSHLKKTSPFKLFEKNTPFNNKLNALSLKPYSKEQIFLNEQDIVDLHKNNVIIGNHGSYHANLAACNKKTLQAEIISNKLFIENIIKSPVDHYAIAFGKKEHYTEEAINTIKESGHAYIYSSNPKAFSKPDVSTLIPRIGITQNSTKEIMFFINRQFLKKINL